MQPQDTQLLFDQKTRELEVYCYLRCGLLTLEHLTNFIAIVMENQYGVVERNKKVLYEAFMKTMEDTKCDIEAASAWAVSAKNALQNLGGYYPNQLF